MNTKAPRDFPSTGRSSRYATNKASFSNPQSPAPASTSTSVPSFTFATSSGFDRRGTHDSTPSTSYDLNGPVGTSSWQASSYDYRNRQSRSSSAANGETVSAPDCDKFFNLLEKASARINDNIRQDTNTSRDGHKRKPLPHSTASTRNVHVKRVRREVHSEFGLDSASEDVTKGKGRELAILIDAPINISGRSARVRKSPNYHQDHAGYTMDVDPPKPSLEAMPPPPVPPLLKKDLMLSPTQVTAHPDHPTFPPKPSFASSSASLESTLTPPSLSFENQREQPIPRTQNASLSNTNVAPGSTPKLHSLLDPERRQRRLKLERTISASLASFSSGSSSDLRPPSDTTVPPVGQPKWPPPRITTHHHTRVLPLSQDGVGARPPPLGMRRTNTFPLPAQNSSDSSNHRNHKVAKPAKEKLRPPLLSSTQLPPTSSSSRSDQTSSHRSSSPLRTLHEQPRREDATTKSIDDEMDEDLSLDSDADLSFGETVKFDIDMDALEETMRQYD